MRPHSQRRCRQRADPGSQQKESPRSQHLTRAFATHTVMCAYIIFWQRRDCVHQSRSDVHSSGNLSAPIPEPILQQQSPARARNHPTPVHTPSDSPSKPHACQCNCERLQAPRHHAGRHSSDRATITHPSMTSSESVRISRCFKWRV